MSFRRQRCSDRRKSLGACAIIARSSDSSESLPSIFCTQKCFGGLAATPVLTLDIGKAHQVAGTQLAPRSIFLVCDVAKRVPVLLHSHCEDLSSLQRGDAKSGTQSWMVHTKACIGSCRRCSWRPSRSAAALKQQCICLTSGSSSW